MTIFYRLYTDPFIYASSALTLSSASSAIVESLFYMITTMHLRKLFETRSEVLIFLGCSGIVILMFSPTFTTFYSQVAALYSHHS